MQWPDINQIPTFPNDLMFLIFNDLSTEERIPLGTTCKRLATLVKGGVSGKNIGDSHTENRALSISWNFAKKGGRVRSRLALRADTPPPRSVCTRGYPQTHHRNWSHASSKEDPAPLQIFRLTDSYKYVTFDISEHIVDEFIRSMMYLPSVDYDWEGDEEDGELCYIFDKSSRTILFASNNDNDESIARVTIAKIDERNNLRIHNDNPTLPNDLMFLIFNELPTVDRIQLGTSCKRFRKIDFELGSKHFERIDISLIDFYQQLSVVGKTGSMEYAIHGNITGHAYPSRHNLSRFRSARTNVLNIACDQSTRSSYNIRDSDFDFIAKICEQIRFASAFIKTNFCESNTIEHLISIIKRFSMKHTQVVIKSSAPQSTSFLYSHLLKQLPKINRFRFDFFTISKWNEHRGIGISESAFHHIVSQTNHAEFDLVQTTAEGIQRVFEMVRNWDGYKFVVFNTDWTTVIEFIALHLVNGTYAFDDTRVTDRSTRTVLIKSDVVHSKFIANVVICKVDADYKIPPLPNDLISIAFSSSRSTFRIRSADFDFLGKLVEQITFKSLMIKANCCDSTSIEQLTSLIKSCKMEKVSFYLSDNENTSHLCSHLLLQLPKLDKFRFQFHTLPSGQANREEEGISESAFLHIVSNTNAARLDKVNYTADGIQRAFEMVKQ
ncbi:hypothetical protein PRIPAC_90450 [Pristionchus pacificus]|uniref:F-box domain-containing protein n=1 Tax=Pristionchus pacificus TaxID=54126 RepID=A0A2A6B9R8_PRIPA|nr:hypothetical protein PRIPAC_90450 [Pristionchus pacificus]|eukprot:PDM62625.1 F-box domain-containing protein [Pristionchus pacificus]